MFSCQYGSTTSTLFQTLSFLHLLVLWLCQTVEFSFISVVIWNPLKKNPEANLASVNMQFAWQSDDTIAITKCNVVELNKLGCDSESRRFSGQKLNVAYMKFDSSGELLATCSHDHTVNIWSSITLKCLPGWDKNVHSEILELRWLEKTNLGSKILATFSKDEVKIWDLEGICLATYNLSSGLLSASPSGNFFSGGKEVRSTQTNKLKWKLPSIVRETYNISWGCQEQMLAIFSFG